MPHPILTGLLIIAAVGVCIAGWMVKSEMDQLDANGDPIEQDEQQ